MKRHLGVQDTEWNEQRAATSREGITRMLLGYEEILKMSRQTSVFDLRSFSGTLACPFVLFGSGDDPDDPPTVQYEVPPPKGVICLAYLILMQFLFRKQKYSFLVGIDRPILTRRLWDNMP